jgi:hypothetical protein
MSGPDSPDPGSVAGRHEGLGTQPAACVAPTEGNAINTIRIPLAPIACWGLADPAFDFDSSFVLPAFAGEVGHLVSLLAAPERKGCPAAIFGHADPTGSDDVNKAISDRRAIAIYALLTRKPAMWEDLYSHPIDGDTWGTRAIQAMLMSLSDSGGAPYYPGPLDDKYGPKTSAAVERFQGENGLTVDGKAGPNTRGKLFPKYMDLICTPTIPPGADSSAPATPFQMQAGDFLGGGGNGGKMALQGCSRFNPVVLLPNSMMNGDPDIRNEQDAPNRRVLVFLFRKESKITESDWPCPRVKESADGCRAQFWPDADLRRQNGDSRREYKTTHDTMACRFYDRFARRSPCEGRAVVAFRYSVYAGGSWPPSTVLQVSSTDGSFNFEQSFGDAKREGDHAVFGLPTFPLNARYAGRLKLGERVFVLFENADLARLLSADTSYDELPAPPEPIAVDP